MWILHFLPDGFLEFVIYAILSVGFVATVVSLVFINPLLKFFPSVAGTYRLIQVASVAVFLLGVYLWGGYSTEMQWRERAAELERLARESEARAVETNAKLNQALTERDFAVATRGKNTVKTITEWRDKDPKEITKDMSPEQAAEYEKKLAELKEYVNKCPVPDLVVKEHNLNVRDQNQNRGWTGEFK